MPTRIEVLMRSANLLNDFAFKYVFGEDCKEANDALKSLLTVFLERKVKFSVQGVQTRLKRNDRFEISDRVAN